VNSGAFNTNEISRLTLTGTTILYISSIKIMAEVFLRHRCKGFAYQITSVLQFTLQRFKAQFTT